jgi:DNA-binding CsgD family transcriptional regulator
MDMGQFSALIGCLYDTALDPMGWPRIAQTIARTFESESCALQLRDTGTGQTTVLGATANLNARALADYEAHYHNTDPWVARANELALGRPVIGQQLIDDAELLTSEWYNDWCRKVGQFHLVGSAFAIGPQAIGVIGIHRPRGDAPFDGEHTRMLGLLLSHLARAMQLYRHLDGLQRERKVALTALDALSVGVMVVAAGGRLLFANTLAESLLRAGQGLMVSYGLLHARDGRKDQALHHAICTVGLRTRDRSAGAEAVLTLPRPEGRPLSLLICPMGAEMLGLEPIQPVAMIFIADPDDQCRPAPETLAKLYSLTPAEARLTAALLDGEQLADYADRLGLSVHTVKTQLKHVFGKTGHGRQADLIRDVLSNPVLRMSREPPGRR